MASHVIPRPIRRALRVVALALVLAGVAAGGLAACGDDDDSVGAGDTTTTAASGGTDDGYGGSGDSGGDTTGTAIVAKDFSLTSITVAPGADVKVDNQGSASHTVTADDGSFDSGTVDGGSSGSLSAPSEPGEYAFHCEIHPSMTGTLTVEG
jgi:plastocyanin